MLHSPAASPVVVRGSASIISFNWPLLISKDLFLTVLLTIKALVSFAKLLKPPLHYMFISSSWAQYAVDVASCVCCFATHFGLK